jgi:hypothetical protein
MPSSLIYWSVAAAGTILLLIRQIRTYMHFRGARVVLCPETSAAAGVEMNALRAATPKLGRRSPKLVLQACSRWPERAGCGQACIRQIEAAPEQCLLRTILAQWYFGKDCALCHERFGEIHWTDHKPALMTTDGEAKAWQDVRAEDVFRITDTHVPICWRCYTVQSFCHEHPELVLNRSRPWPPFGSA